LTKGRAIAVRARDVVPIVVDNRGERARASQIAEGLRSISSFQRRSRVVRQNLSLIEDRRY
jgi:hypothetical protein